MISGTHNRLSNEIARQTQLQRDIEKLQTQVSTGKRLGAPSDDPGASTQLSQVGRTQRNQAAYAANAETAATVATRVDFALSTATTALDRAREIAVMAASDTYSDDQRAAFASELRNIAVDLAASAAQTDARGLPLFPTGTPAGFPIADGVTASGTVGRATVFEGVATAQGPRTIAAILEDAAVAAESGTAADRGNALDAIGRASDHVIRTQAFHGVEASRIDRVIEELGTRAVDLEDQRATLEVADIGAAIALIQSKLTTLSAAQAVFAKVNRQTLFDVLG